MLDLDIRSNHHVQLMASVLDLIDNERNGEVSALILAWRAEGVSVEKVAVRLHDFDIHVTSKTVDRWLKRQEPAAS